MAWPLVPEAWARRTPGAPRAIAHRRAGSWGSIRRIITPASPGGVRVAIRITAEVNEGRLRETEASTAEADIVAEMETLRAGRLGAQARGRSLRDKGA